MKKLLLGTTVAVFAAMTLTAGVASARGHGDGECRPEITFEMLDTDSNGAITEAEMTAKAAEKFNAQDSNGDGFLDADELLAAGQERMENRRGNRDNSNANPQRDAQRAEMAALMIEHLFERQDANNDGMLSIDEMKPDRAGDRFEDADTDGDGAISEAEFEAAKGARGDGHGKKRSGGHRGCNEG